MPVIDPIPPISLMCPMGIMGGMGTMRRFAAAGWLCCAAALTANAGTTMTVSGPVVTIGDYISNGPGVLEKRWRYDITNTSSSGDINNMIEWHVNAGSNNNVLAITKNHSGTGTINLFTNSSSSGFTGLLPPASGIPNNNKVSIFLYTPATTGTAAGEAGATARADGLFRRHHADNPGGGTRHRGPAAAQRLDGCRRLSRVLPGAAG